MTPDETWVNESSILLWLCSIHARPACLLSWQKNLLRKFPRSHQQILSTLHSAKAGENDTNTSIRTFMHLSLCRPCGNQTWNSAFCLHRRPANYIVEAHQGRTYIEPHHLPLHLLMQVAVCVRRRHTSQWLSHPSQDHVCAMGLSLPLTPTLLTMETNLCGRKVGN